MLKNIIFDWVIVIIIDLNSQNLYYEISMYKSKNNKNAIILGIRFFME